MNAIRRVRHLQILRALLLATTATLASANLHAVEPRDPGASRAERMDRELSAIMARAALPGLAVVVVDGQRVTYQRALGVTEIRQNQPVTVHTRFKIGSISKPISALAIGLLVQDRKLGWEDRLVAHIPELAHANPRVARLTITQLLSHTTELNLDLLEPLLWPQPNTFHTSDLIAGLAALSERDMSAEAFRYSNVNYALVGELVRRASGRSYGKFVEQRIFKPLGMNCAVGGFDRSAPGGLAQPHLIKFGVAEAIRRDQGIVNEGLDAAAGGIRCDIRAMAKWLRFQLNPRDSRLAVDGAVWDALHTALASPRLAFDASARPLVIERYGRGIQIVSDATGLRFDHYGGVAGSMAYFAVYPGRNAGFALLMNASAASARTELIDQLHAWMANQPAPAAPRLPDTGTTVAGVGTLLPTRPPLDAAAEQSLLGHYRDPWFGEMRICKTSGRTEITSMRSPRFVGDVVQTAKSPIAVLWRDPAIDSDAVIRTQSSRDGKIERFVLDPLDVSDFDFSAMRFTRVGECEANN